MASIQVTPELLRGKANELRGIKSQHDEEMQKLRTLVMGLEEIFKGEAHDAFVAQYESMQPVFVKFAEMLDTYAAQLDTAAGKFEVLDGEIAGSIPTFG